MSTKQISSCGRGLAAHATLPATVGEVMAAMAQVLDVHQTALDLSDEQTRPEHHAYLTLVQELRSASSLLTGVAERMAGYRDLPMGRHDERRMAGPDALEAFARFVDAERRLLSLLQESISGGEAMLKGMRDAATHSTLQQR
jgi:hypothetical protein